MLRHHRLIFTLLLTLSLSSFGETLYVSQSGSGSGTGVDTSNRASAAFFNTSGNWGSGAGKISAGDTVSLGGTITTPLVIQGSGSAGNVITILFESGASMSRTNWNQGGTSVDSALYMTTKDYITIDGGSNGIIESTANGTSLASQLDNNGVYILDSSHIIVKNLTIRNIYVRVNGATADYLGSAVALFDNGTHSMTDIRITANTISACGHPIDVSFNTLSSLEIDNNTITDCGIAINIGDTSSNRLLTTCLIHDNSLSMGLAWSGTGSIHKNCIHAFAFASGSFINGLKFYNNFCGGDMGDNATGYVFLEGGFTSPLIYNNVLQPPNINYGGNGLITIKGTTDCVIANNTIIGFNNAGTGIGTTAFGLYGTGLTITNNLMYHVGNQIVDNIPAISSCDYNVYAFPDTTGWSKSGSFFNTFAQWKVLTGFDSHSTTNAPTIDGNYAPTGADTVARNAGSSMTAFFTTDKNGTARPQESVWDIGAFEFNPGGAPTLISATIPTGGTTITLVYSAAVTSGAGGTGGSTISMSGGAATMTYSSGTGTTTLVYNLNRTVNSGETGTTSYTQPGNGWEAVSDATDVATYSGATVTNNSSQGGGADTGGPGKAPKGLKVRR